MRTQENVYGPHINIHVFFLEVRCCGMQLARARFSGNRAKRKVPEGCKGAQILLPSSNHKHLFRMLPPNEYYVVHTHISLESIQARGSRDALDESTPWLYLQQKKMGMARRN